VIVVITGDIKRSEAKNGAQGTLFTHVEAGFIGQNIFLQAGALNLGAGVAGGFKDKPLAQALKLPENDVPFLVMPWGISTRAKRRKGKAERRRGEVSAAGHPKVM
jgi:nitroreductase